MMMGKMLVPGIRTPQSRSHHQDSVIGMVEDGRVAVDHIVTHRMACQRTPDASHLLYNRPDEALAVLLEWD